jgi:hypothetical protein
MALGKAFTECFFMALGKLAVSGSASGAGLFQGTDVLPMIEVCSRVNSVEVHEPSEKSYLPGEPAVPDELRTWKLHIIGMHVA